MRISDWSSDVCSSDLGHARAEVWPSLEAVARAVSRMHSHATVDITGDRHAAVAGERQDLEEMLGNLIENAAKYGSGRVFVTVERNGEFIDLLIEDDGPGLHAERRYDLFGRGPRLDTLKPRTGLGLLNGRWAVRRGGKG